MLGGGRVRGSVTRRPPVRAAEARASDTARCPTAGADGRWGCQQGLHSMSGVLLKRGRSMQPLVHVDGVWGPFPGCPGTAPCSVLAGQQELGGPGMEQSHSGRRTLVR